MASEKKANRKRSSSSAAVAKTSRPMKQAKLSSVSAAGAGTGTSSSKPTLGIVRSQSRSRSRSRRPRNTSVSSHDGLLETFEAHAILAYTDGACQGNNRSSYSPCGAGAAVFFPETATWRDKAESLGSGTNSIGELYGVRLALEVLDLEEKAQPGCIDGAPIEIFTDSKYCQGVLSLNWQASANRELVMEIRHLIADRARRNPLRIHWVKAHAGIEGNERANTLAQHAAEASASARNNASHGASEIKTTATGISDADGDVGAEADVGAETAPPYAPVAQPSTSSATPATTMLARTSAPAAPARDRPRSVSRSTSSAAKPGHEPSQVQASDEHEIAPRVDNPVREPRSHLQQPMPPKMQALFLPPSSVDDQEQKTSLVRGRAPCVVCHEQPANVVLLDCGHTTCSVEFTDQTAWLANTLSRLCARTPGKNTWPVRAQYA
jgi:ribonuclease HI